MKFESLMFEFHGVFTCRCLPAGDSRRYLRRAVLEGVVARSGKEKRSKEQNLKELDFRLSTRIIRFRMKYPKRK
jgi:hypothetical protein